MSLTAQYIVSPDAVQSFLSHSAVFSHRSIAFSSAVFTATATRNRVYHVITAVAIVYYCYTTIQQYGLVSLLCLTTVVSL